jgi:radical SAM protein with 4Fe4S-binding SPASM domain
MMMSTARSIVLNSPFDVTITGGEPLLMGGRHIRDLCELFSENSIDCSLNMNGRLLTPDTCATLAQCGLKGLLISLHSWTDDVHNGIVGCSRAAAETKAGIRNALDAGLPVTVNSVVDGRNVDTLFASAKELQKLGVVHLSFTRALCPLEGTYKCGEIDSARFVDEVIRCQEELRIAVSSLLPLPFCAHPRVKEMKRKLCCSGGVTTAVLSYRGDVRFCPHDTRVWGNIFKEELASIWARMSKWRCDVGIPNECAICAFVEDCRGGCRIAAKVDRDSYRAMDPWATCAVTNYRRVVNIDEFDLDCSYAVASGIRWRPEHSHCLLYCGSGRLLTNPDGVEFVRCLPPSFIPRELLHSSTRNRETQYRFLKDPYCTGLIAKVVGNGGGASNVAEKVSGDSSSP